MKKLLIIPLIALAAGCGSAGAGSTVTSPTKTVHVTDSTNSLLQSSACEQAMEKLLDANGTMIDVADAYLNGNYAKGSTKLDKWNHQFDAAKPLVNLCRAGG